MMKVDFKKLKEPFPANMIEWRAQNADEKNGRQWVMVLAYVQNRAIMNRLDDVCGPENWKNEFRDIANNGVECTLYIRHDGEWIGKTDAAQNTKIESVKGGRSDAMKRAAVQWGIGRYLYDLEAGFGVINPKGKHSAKAKSTNNWFKWDPPPLPAWALPPVPETEPKPKPTAWKMTPEKQEELKKFCAEMSFTFNQGWLKANGITPETTDEHVDIKMNEIREARENIDG